MIILIIMLTISVVLNALLIWYSIYAAKQFKGISEDLSKAEFFSKEFADHLELVYNMEKFFGDEVLENLLKHAKDISGEFRGLWENYSLEKETINDRDGSEEEAKEE